MVDFSNGLFRFFDKETKGEFDMQIFYNIGKTIDIRTEFESSVKRPISQRIDNGFIKTYKPIIDDEPYRIFETMEEYRKWCKEKLADWLGYGESI